ncbi:epoxide hydrolase 3-like [Rutidosis leptorrhynchoides]|uniref:epoxide hydrolase 3-like n=1 Tax=Rutidosis leptorrhynchoides TaxID=125765 RepID=UPI003A991F08
MEGIQHKKVQIANGINIHIAEKGDGPLVLFIHGFPELWYSWRHQIVYLADHGYRAVAPDLRGYGGTTGAPVNDPTKFSIIHLVSDMIGLLDAITNEGEKVFVVGHDWGAIVAWNLCTFRPERVKALVNLSVPFLPWNPDGNVVELMRKAYGEDHYMVRFQEPGAIENGVARLSIQEFLKKFLTYRDLEPLYISKDVGFRHSPGDTPVIMPSWLSEEDVNYFASQLDKTTITGGVDYYRALPVDWEISAAYQGAKVTVPTKFIIGDQDWCLEMFNKEYILGDGFKSDVPLLEDVVLMKGAAHFINQEKPDEINKHILEFLQKF